MRDCLEKIFNRSVNDVRIIEKPSPNAKYIVTTRRNEITIKIPCDTFLEDPLTVLEEYYHVLEQWNTGRMSRLGYAWEFLKHGYDNKFEREAKDFANRHESEFNKCLDCK